MRPVLVALGVPAAGPRRTAPPRAGVCPTEPWPLAAPESRLAVETLRRGSPARARRSPRPDDEFAGVTEAQKTVMLAEVARALAAEQRIHGDR